MTMSIADDLTTDSATDVMTTLSSLQEFKKMLQSPAALTKTGKLFYTLHITGLVSLSISIAASLAVIAYLTWTSKLGHFKRKIGLRLVLYLAICDLFFSVSHLVDHAYFLVTLANPRDPVCITIAFFVSTSFLSQHLIILFMAVSATLLVVRDKNIDLGRYDWRLLLLAPGLPIVEGLAGALVPFFGPSGGAWCVVDLRKPYGNIINHMYSFLSVAVLLTIAINYLVMWVHIRQAATPTGGVSSYSNTAKLLTLFVVAFLCQICALPVQAIWMLFDQPHFGFILFSVITVDLGGVYNMLVYTVIKRGYFNTQQPAINSNIHN